MKSSGRYGTRVSKGLTAAEVTPLEVDWKSYPEHRLSRPKQTLGYREPCPPPESLFKIKNMVRPIPG